MRVRVCTWLWYGAPSGVLRSYETGYFMIMIMIELLVLSSEISARIQCAYIHSLLLRRVNVAS